MNTKRIHLISTPRNLSTALMYSFAQRTDTTVVDEPLYAHYLTVSGVEHPGQEDILNSQNKNGEEVIQQLFLGETPSSVLFLKNMAHHLIAVDLSFLKQVTTLFLIRNPRQLITSYAKVRHRPTEQDIGLKRQYELYHLIKENGHTPHVLDSGELLKNPPLVLNKVCDALNIAFDERMLSWKAEPRIEDGVWAKYWYKSVHNSTGFKKQPSSEHPLPDYLTDLYAACKPYYDFLHQQSIKAV